MNELDIKIKQLREYCLNINAIDDIEIIKDLFIDLNSYILNHEQTCTINESLIFMIEQLTYNRDKVSNANDIKIEIVKDIIQNNISNILEPAYYHYYLYMREYISLGRHDINSILENLYTEDISFLNEIQKISFINYLNSIKLRLEDKDVVDLVLEKINTIEISTNTHPEFAPSKIKQLEEQNKALQEELANVNYILMMQDMI